MFSRFFTSQINLLHTTNCISNHFNNLTNCHTMSEELNNDNVGDRLLVIGATTSKFANTMTQVVKVIATAVNCHRIRSNR